MAATPDGPRDATARPAPNVVVRAAKALRFGAFAVPAGGEFPVHVHWSIGGLIRCTLPDGQQVDLKDRRLIDHDIEFVRHLD